MQLPHSAKLVTVYLPSGPAHLSPSHFIPLLSTYSLSSSSSATAICTSSNYCRLLLHTHPNKSTLCSHLTELCEYLLSSEARCKPSSCPLVLGWHLDSLASPAEPRSQCSHQLYVALQKIVTSGEFRPCPSSSLRMGPLTQIHPEHLFRLEDALTASVYLISQRLLASGMLSSSIQFCKKLGSLYHIPGL